MFTVFYKFSMPDIIFPLEEGSMDDIFRFEDDFPDWSTGFDSSEW